MSLRTIRNRCRYWAHRRQRARDLAEEVETHRSLRQAALERAGWSPADAARASRRALGNTTLALEEVRDIWILRRLDESVRDVRHGARLLRRSPAFTAIAVLSLALGIGANTAIFSLIDAVVLKTLPVERPSQLVVLERVNTRGGRSNFSFPLFESLRAPDRVFSGMFAALDGAYRLELDGRGATAEADTVQVQAVSGEYFQVLGVRTAVGRLLSPDDDRPGGSGPVAVLSDGFWRRRFAGDPAAIGQRITLKHESMTIVGVAPAGFFGESIGRAPDLWVPLAVQPRLSPPELLSDPRVGWLRVMARLQPDTTLAQARVATETRLAGLKAGSGPLAQSLRQVAAVAIEPGSRGLSDTRTRFSRELWILMVVAAVVLLIACANVANLLLVRGAARQQETTLRLAIGASRARLVRQFLTESVLLASLGGALGLLVAWWGSQSLLLLASDAANPLAIDVTPDLRMLAFTSVASIATVLFFGLVPASVAVRQDINGAPRAIAVRGRATLPRVLLALQVGLSLLLLTAAGLFLQTLGNLRAVDLGFAADEIVQAAMNPAAAGYASEQLPDLYQRLLARFEGVPGIRAASLSGSGFRTGASRTCCIAIEGRLASEGEDREVQTTVVTADYFRTMGVVLMSGRSFTSGDVAAAEPGPSRVAIVNQAMARQHFGTDAAVGRRFGWGDAPAAKYDTEVIGVVGNALYGDLRKPAVPLVYYPGAGGPYLMVRAAAAAASAGLVRREIQAIDPNLDADVRSVAQIRNEALVLERLLARLSAFFGGAALLLASIGLYGLMAYAVTRRTREIGIRIALGAQRSSVVRQVFRETMAPLVAGILFGAGAAVLAAQLLTSVLFGVTPHDPAALGLSILVLIVVAVLAGLLPARRAARVEPSVALRHE